MTSLTVIDIVIPLLKMSTKIFYHKVEKDSSL